MAGENRNGAVDQDFGDGTYTFRLALGELEELQEKTGLGPFVVMQRLASNEWKTSDVRETLRIGLIGGGTPAADALRLVRRYVDDRPDWLKNALIARVVVQSALIGAPEELPGKEPAPEAETED